MMNKILKTLSKHLAVSFFIFSLLLICSLLLLWILQPKSTDQISPQDIKISQPALCKDCNVILIAMTNLRYDHMSQNGYFRPTTPNLDNLAKDSLIFDNAFSQSSWTLPQGISVFSGLYPYQHGVMNRYDGSKLSEGTPTLIDIINVAGYKTAAFTGGFDYNPKFGLTNRFSEYQECAKGEKALDDYGRFDCTIPKALDWLKKNGSQKFFLFLQGYDAHCPFSQRGGITYDANYKGSIDYQRCLWTFDRVEPIIKEDKTFYPVHSPTTGMEKTILLSEKDVYHLIALYDESITSADKLIGSFLDEVKKMGLSDKTIIVFTSEHGDMFGKYGRFMRGGPLRGTFYDDVLHVPLIIRHPKLASGRYQELVEQIDLTPTFFDFLGLRHDLPLQGKSLIPLILEGKNLHEYVFAGAKFNPDTNNFWFPKKTIIEAVRSKEWKLIRETIFEDSGPSKTMELYDIVNDKEELKNLTQTQKDILRDLQLKLTDWSEKMRQ